MNHQQDVGILAAQEYVEHMLSVLDQLGAQQRIQLFPFCFFDGGITCVGDLRRQFRRHISILVAA